MKAKEKAIKYCQKNKLVVPFFSKKVNRVFDEALDIAIQEAKKERAEEIFDDIDKYSFVESSEIGFRHYVKVVLKKKHLGS